MSRDADKFWRLDFHEIEREVIKSAGFSRNVVRLLKVSDATLFLDILVVPLLSVVLFVVTLSLLNLFVCGRRHKT